MVEYLSYLQLIILGIVQGITELLPISSSAHLIISNIVLKSNYDSNLYLTSLHLGTTLAIILYFYKDLIYFCTKRNLIILLIISSIPAILVGVFFNDIIEIYFRNPLIIVFSLILVGILMIFIEKRYKDSEDRIDSFDKLTLKEALTIGIAQSLALIPGISRSGITTIAGISVNLSKEFALKFVFILGIPILLGSFAYEFIQTENAMSIVLRPDIILGVIVSSIVGYISIYILKKYLINNFLTIFGYYRIGFGIFLLILVLLNYI